MKIFIRAIIKVTIQDILIILGFLLVSCGIEKLGGLVGDITAFVVFLITWPVLFILFFYSNAELFKWVKNNYAWSMSSGLPSIILAIYSVMYAVHNTCKIPFIE